MGQGAEPHLYLEGFGIRQPEPCQLLSARPQCWELEVYSATHLPRPLKALPSLRDMPEQVCTVLTGHPCALSTAHSHHRN